MTKYTIEGNSLDDKLKAASDWFVKNQAADCSEEDCSNFLLWLQSDPQNEACYQQIEATWEISAGLASTEEFTAQPAAAQPKPRQWLQGLFAVAASVIMAFGVWFQLFDGVHTTALGEQKLIVLDDNSSIRLNTNTKLKVKFSDHERRIYLQQGEAIFSVAHNKSRPFIVEAGEHTTTALGTEFNIQQLKNHYTVTVLEGSVEVAATSATSSNESDKPVLVAGQEVSYSEQQLSTPAAAKLSRIVAWQAGKLDFDAETLANVVAEVNRYSHKQIILGNAELEASLISGTFRIGDVQAIVQALAETLPLWVVENPDHYLLKPIPKAKDQQTKGSEAT